MLDPSVSRRQYPMDSSAVYSHSRTRTTSSNTFPVPVQSPAPMHLAHNPHQHTRRSPSVNTFSTSSSIPPPAAYRTSPTTDLRRSTSSRSGGSIQPTGYVALLRKQKATVWCDRAQYEDPRLLAQQRAAKMRATLEVIGGQRASSGLSAPSGRTTTGISATGKVAAKIRHHGKPGVVGYAPGDHHFGVGGVPMRLSATEVEAESSDDDDPRLHHRRTGSSGRSSTASRRGPGYRSSGGLGSGSGRRWSPGDTPERSGSLVEDKQEETLGDNASGRAMTTGSSGSSAERADNIGDLGGAARLASNSLMHSTVTREKSVKGVDDLRRRGSVDDRTKTLTGGRLYIANPD
ncbi:hypothetical protein C8034_v004425 [Colletotrichum sidae]|uniref:Uncharacterized protein n=4 Tax=Colletotrichum orbiculare species complex TaxID=2707354 RepID=N4VF56_COLOR|nr:hypothetical protein Cob_v007551 [Colletotrichum orbiculare MAFF 240422]TDZ38215.1 hypothetical protein C8035_v006805 [Colletotrichum spinosum]TDZ65253.1 hypothetical protein CTRI78_v003577 [Colletotrichum trifolii]TEA13613.1 hypothetical protein C8034_v004425 [Colletotrichum sidae]